MSLKEGCISPQSGMATGGLSVGRIQVTIGIYGARCIYLSIKNVVFLPARNAPSPCSIVRCFSALRAPVLEVLRSFESLSNFKILYAIVSSKTFGDARAAIGLYRAQALKGTSKFN